MDSKPWYMFHTMMRALVEQISCRTSTRWHCVAVQCWFEPWNSPKSGPSSEGRLGKGQDVVNKMHLVGMVLYLPERISMSHWSINCYKPPRALSPTCS